MEESILELQKELRELKKQFHQTKKSNDISSAIFKLNHIVAIEIGLVYLLVATFGKTSDEITILNVTMQSNIVIAILSITIVASMWKEMLVVSKWLFSKTIGVRS